VPGLFLSIWLSSSSVDNENFAAFDIFRFTLREVRRKSSMLVECASWSILVTFPLGGEDRTLAENVRLMGERGFCLSMEGRYV
jgi:hypothetical protein